MIEKTKLPWGQVALEGNFRFVLDKSDLKSASDKTFVRKATVALKNKIYEQNTTPCCERLPWLSAFFFKVQFLSQWTSPALYTNIPQEEGITTVCKAYEEFYEENPSIPTKYLREMLSLILQENSFQFNGTAMDTKMAVAFANIFMAKIENEVLRQSTTKPIFWKRFIDDVIRVTHYASRKAS